MIIRKFYLADKRNPNNQFNLNIADEAYLTNPSGLGYELDTSYTRVGNHYVANYRRDRQVPITGNIVNVAADPYTALQPFLNYIRDLKEPILVYHTTAGTYFKDVDITSFGKTEMSKKALSCPITFIPKSLWYRNLSTENLLETVDESDDDTKTYTYHYPYVYGLDNQRMIEIHNDGSVEAQFKVDFRGVLTNPEIRVIQDGIELNRVLIPTDIKENEVLHYSAIDGELQCYLEGEHNINLIGLLPIGEDNANFFGIPLGDCMLIITTGGSLDGKVDLEVQQYYRAV